MLNVEFLTYAENELQDAFEFYEYQQENLGYRFVDEVYKSIELIKFYPEGWSKVSKNTRRCLIKNFPYGIIYHKLDETIIIIAIANLHRRPNYWVNRINNK